MYIYLLNSLSTVLQVEFLNASYTVMEGERADLIMARDISLLCWLGVFPVTDGSESNIT